MLNNLGNVSLYLVSMAYIARFLGFSLYLVCFVHGNNVFKVFLSVMVLGNAFLVTFCFVWSWEQCFWLFLFVKEVETLFRIAFGLWGEEKPCFLVPVG